MSEAQRLQEAFEFREPESETRQRGKVLRAAFVRDQEVQALLHDDSVESNTPSSNEFQPHSGEYSDDHVIVGGESVAKATSNGVSEAKSNAPKIDEAYLASELSKRRVMEEKLRSPPPFWTQESHEAWRAGCVSHRNACMDDFLEALSYDNLCRSVCAVCNCLIFRRSTEAYCLGHIPNRELLLFDAHPRLPSDAARVQEGLFVSPLGIGCDSALCEACNKVKNAGDGVIPVVCVDVPAKCRRGCSCSLMCVVPTNQCASVCSDCLTLLKSGKLFCLHWLAWEISWPAFASPIFRNDFR